MNNDKQENKEKNINKQGNVWIKRCFICLYLAFLIWGSFVLGLGSEPFFMFIGPSIATLAILFYVFYTREIAKANLFLVEATLKLQDRPHVVEAWDVRYVDKIDLINGGDEISRKIMDEINIPQEERSLNRVLFCRLTNFSVRPIVPKKITLRVGYSAGTSYDLNYCFENIILMPGKDTNLQIILDVKGLIHAETYSFEFLDWEGGVNTKFVQNPFNEPMFTKPTT